MKTIQETPTYSQSLRNVDSIGLDDTLSIEAYDEPCGDGEVSPEDPIVQSEKRIIACRKRRDELFLAISKGDATQEQLAAYNKMCGEVREAQTAYGAAFFGSVACKGDQSAVA